MDDRVECTPGCCKEGWNQKSGRTNEPAVELSEKKGEGQTLFFDHDIKRTGQTLGATGCVGSVGVVAGRSSEYLSGKGAVDSSTCCSLMEALVGQMWRARRWRSAGIFRIFSEEAPWPWNCDWLGCELPFPLSQVVAFLCLNSSLTFLSS